MLSRKICSNPFRILSFIWQFSESGCQHGTFLESLLHADVFRRLFNIVCFETLVFGCYFRKFVRILRSVWHLWSFFIISSKNWPSSVSSIFIFHNLSFMLLSCIGYLPSIFIAKGSEISSRDFVYNRSCLSKISISYIA